MGDKKLFKKPKTLFNNQKTDPASVSFAEECLDNRLLKKLKKSSYDVDKQLFKLVNLADSKTFLDDGKSPSRTDYVEKKEIDRSTLYSFDGPFASYRCREFRIPGKDCYNSSICSCG